MESLFNAKTEKDVPIGIKNKKINVMTLETSMPIKSRPPQLHTPLAASTEMRNGYIKPWMRCTPKGSGNSGILTTAANVPRAEIFRFPMLKAQNKKEDEGLIGRIDCAGRLILNLSLECYCENLHECFREYGKSRGEIDDLISELNNGYDTALSKILG